ncbi:MAG TPA: hypothetical protein DC054_14195 [Blastocatellia bacterium]|nr:hypothetical protein [Blastocatellia bacterium]
MIVVICLGWALVCCRAEQSPFSSDSLTPRQKELGGQLTKVTTSYLNQKIGVAGFGGKPFCGYKLLDVEENEKGIFEYLDVLCQEYYLKGNGKLEKGTGIMQPVALTITKSNGDFQIVKHEVPRDGDGFNPDIEALFPKKAQQEIRSDLRNGWGQSILSQLTVEAAKYYATNSNRAP